MNAKQAKLFQAEILKALRDGSKIVSQIHGILNRKYPQYCDDAQKESQGKIKWKHEVSDLLNKMQGEFTIYRDPLIKEWKIVE